MSMRSRSADEVEPPSITAVAEARSAALVERVWAIARLSPSAHVVIIGRHTLPLMLECLRRGCAAARSLQPDTPSPDCEAADLAWIVDVREDELDQALRAARSRAARMIVDAAAGALPVIRDRAFALGLDVVAFDHAASRLLLAIVPRRAPLS